MKTGITKNNETQKGSDPTEPAQEYSDSGGRSDWEWNHSKIRDAMLELIDEKRGKIPSQNEIADRTGLSRVTVQRHMKEMELLKIAKPFRMLADTVLLGLANKAVRGDTSAARLYFKLTFGTEMKTGLQNEVGPDDPE